MVFLHIDKSNAIMDKETNVNPSLKLDNLIQDNNRNKIFVLIHMEGCGPCMETLPEWKKLEHVLKNYANRNDIVIVDIERQSLNHVKNIKKQPNSFPTMRYITNKGKIVENYEDSNVKNKDRSIDSFVEWINLKIKEDNKFAKHNKTLKNKHKRGGGKWSLKYKRSINCRQPRGFSQKQYCKYGRKK
jgi:hypothetical protein